jgi:hypothetical protein
MLRMPLKRCFLAVCLTVLLSVFLPVQAKATLLPIDTVSLDYDYAGKIASLEVNVWLDDGSGLYRYDYDLTNQSSGLTLSYVSVGYGPGQSVESYVVPSGNKVKVIKPLGDLIAGALQITLNPTLVEKDSLDFSVVYNDFVSLQNITVRGVVDGSLNTQFRTFEYEKPEPSSPVPEPGTLLLLGSGIMGLGALARKKLRRRKAL